MSKPVVVVAITSSIAAFKSAQLVSDLLKKGYDVEVMMSKNATEFIQPLTFSSLTKKKTMVDTFERDVDWNVEHIALAKRADVCIVAPATANIIGKLANGIADDFVSTTIMAMKCPIIIAPAMNTAMYENPIVQHNMDRLKEFGYYFVEPVSGLLACNDIGKGKLADLYDLMDQIEYVLAPKPLKGRNILISAGPTIEAIDPVRFISNPSTGKMGYALAKVARNLGANVTLVHGVVALRDLPHVHMVETKSAQAMFDYFKEHMFGYDIIIKSAAVADYRVAEVADEKIKKHEDTLTLTLIKNPDILQYVGDHKKHHQVVCGFAMESENLEENAIIKKNKKHLDLIVANNIKEPQAGFGHDTNKVLMIDDTTHAYPVTSKETLAEIILNRLEDQLQKKLLSQ